MNNTTSSGTQQLYARAFQGGDAVARYFRKLDNRIDRLRDAQEAHIFGARLSGRLFDCTLGVGRLIGRLPRVTTYGGMDLSPEFVSFVRSRYPDATAQVGDLTQGIDQPDNAYDSVLCLRSLSAIGHVARILAEMTRIARPGGMIAFDYGRAPKAFRMRGVAVTVDAEDVEPAIASLPVEIVERVRVDGVLARIKARPRIFRLVNGRYGGFIPDIMLSAAERAAAPLLWQREIIFLRKRGRPD